MAHFAHVDETSIVTSVIVIPDSEEERGQEFISSVLGLSGNWVQTSYTSRGGARIDPVTNETVAEGDHFRYNFAGIGFTWDENFGENGAFIPPKPEGMNSWVVNPLSADWVPPLPKPEEGYWVWDEDTTSWVEIPETE